MSGVGVAKEVGGAAWREVRSVATREPVASPYDASGHAYVNVLDRRSANAPKVSANDALRLVRVVAQRTVTVPYENVRSIVEL